VSSEPIGEASGSGSLVTWGRPLALAAVPLFVVSSAFPVVAGLSRNTASFSKWWGVADVSLAFILAVLAFAIVGLADGKITPQATASSYHAYRLLTHVIFVLIVAFFLLGDRIVWLNCLPGFAWRAWVLLYSLPAWFTALKSRAVE
jgi:hypothetical protein